MRFDDSTIHKVIIFAWWNSDIADLDINLSCFRSEANEYGHKIQVTQL
jgi:hypothetical protein